MRIAMILRMMLTVPMLTAICFCEHDLADGDDQLLQPPGRTRSPPQICCAAPQPRRQLPAPPPAQGLKV